MADSPNKPDVMQGNAVSSVQEGIAQSEIVALLVSGVWVVLISGLLIIFPSGAAQDGFDPLRFVMTILAVIMPVGLLWAVLLVGRALRLVRDDARRLGQMIDTLRLTVIADRSSRSADIGPVERKMSDIAQAARATESKLATFSSKREPERQPLVRPLPTRLAEEQPALALGTAPDEGGPPLLRQDMIRALNFPDTDKDEEGFSALRRALRDRQARQLVQASQDVLTLLSQDGIYMDDLNPDKARPEVWRRFAAGERGRTVAALGGVRDRSCLALTMGRMREDMIFRDAAHHFLRLFDRMLVSFEREASDEELSDLSETRTARAFMLLGRVTGAFD